MRESAPIGPILLFPGWDWEKGDGSETMGEKMEAPGVLQGVEGRAGLRSPRGHILIHWGFGSCNLNVRKMMDGAGEIWTFNSLASY